MGRVGEGVLVGNIGLGLAEHLQPLADPVLIYQRQGGQARGVGAHEPVDAVGGHPGHFHIDVQLALIIAGAQVVQMRDLDEALIALRPRLFLQAAIPEGGALELALVLDDPDDVINPVQTLAVTALVGRFAKGLELSEARLRGALLHGAQQISRRAFALRLRLGQARRQQNGGREDHGFDWRHITSGLTPQIGTPEVEQGLAFVEQPCVRCRCRRPRPAAE
ncbi:hypothetical protein D3C72_1417560 [compost metagenome]